MKGKLIPALAAAALLAVGTAAQTTVLSDNLAAFPFLSEMASTDDWLCASFSTDAKTYELISVELKLSNWGTLGAGDVTIYTGVGAGIGQPGVLVGTLTPFDTSTSPLTFTASGIVLDPATTYWVVLRATVSGALHFWKWTPEDAGTGVGFQHTWGLSDNAGASWTTYDSAPLMMRVTAEALPWTDLGFALPGVSGTPELSGDGSLVAGTPGTLALGNAAPAAPAILFASLASSPMPFKGGLLLPTPVTALFLLATSPTGDLPLGWSAWPPGLSGLSLYFQFAIVDAMAVKGVALSNALAADVP